MQATLSELQALAHEIAANTKQPILQASMEALRLLPILEQYAASWDRAVREQRGDR